MRLLREDFKSNKLGVLRSGRDWDGIVQNCMKGQFWGRFFTQSLGLRWPIKKNVRVPKTVTWCNRPFPSFPRPLYQKYVKCSAFDMEMIFYSHANKTHFHKKGSALGLILKVKGFWNSEVAYSTWHLNSPVQRATSKWPIRCNNRVG